MPDSPLPDDTYDAFIVWAERDEIDAGAHARVALDITVTTGAHKGEVVTVMTRATHRDPIELVGLPCTLVVEAGRPRVELEADG